MRNVSITDEVLSAVRERGEALASGDPAWLADVLHQDFLWTSHRGERFDRAGYVEANTRHLVWRSQELSEPRVRVVGEAAVVTGTVHDHVERDGVAGWHTMPVTMIWARVDGRWLCLGGHAGPSRP